MPDQETRNWLCGQAYTVLAELMTGDDDQLALRAAQTVLAYLEREKHGGPEQVEGQRIVIHYGEFAPKPPAGGAAAAPGPGRNPGQSGPFPGGRLRTPLGQDRDREDSCA